MFKQIIIEVKDSRDIGKDDEWSFFAAIGNNQTELLKTQLDELADYLIQFPLVTDVRMVITR